MWQLEFYQGSLLDTVAPEKANAAPFGCHTAGINASDKTNHTHRDRAHSMSKKQPDWDTKNPFRILPSTHGGQVTNFSRQDEMSDLTSLMEAEHDVQVLLTK